MKRAARTLLILALSESLCWQTRAQTAPALSRTQLPTGGKIVGGQVTLQSTGSTLNVNQTSQRGIVEWDTFNVGSQAKINFVQPSASAVTLNRVMDMNASQILGRISATGQVFIANPNGIIFGTSAQIDVAGLVATTKSISNTDFLAGKTTFEGNGQAGSVVNQGTLQATLGGYIALLAPQVRNEGVIVAREGTVALAAGDKTTLEFSGARLVSVIVERPVIDALVENKQMIRAEGGYVVLSARSANAILNSVIKQSGTIDAPTLVQREGRILLEGGEKGVVTAGGSLNVSGVEDGTTGGRIVVTGDKVAITQEAKFDATGQAGGGKINIGGGWQGQDPSIRPATAVTVASGALLDASAIQSGNGGEVVVWSDIQKAGGMTQVAGELRARGGATQGDGGRIETSGHWLSTTGVRGDASAPKGAAGQWLFDPYDVTITAADTVFTSENAAAFAPSATGSNIVNTRIKELLDGGTYVTISTGASGSAGAEMGNITVNADITQSVTAPAARLTLTANKDITINNAVSLTKSGSKLELNTGNGGNIYLAGAVTADTLSMNLTGAGTVTQAPGPGAPPLSANNLRVVGTGAQVTLANPNNHIGVIAANVASISLSTDSGIDLGDPYGKGLYVGNVEETSGITALGPIRLASYFGNIFVKQTIWNKSASSDSNAIVLNAGKGLDVGPNLGSDRVINPYGPNIVLSAGADIKMTDTQSTAILYSGSSSNSGLVLRNYMGANSGRFRYNSNESITNFNLASLSTGLYAIYRENPTLTVTAVDTSSVYGASVTPTYAIAGYLNGDSQAQAVSTAPSVAIGGSTSTAGYWTAGSHALTASGAQSSLGYGISYTDGSLSVSKKALTISATAVDKTYDASTAATSFISSDKFQNDQVTLNSTTSMFENKYAAGVAKTVTVGGLSISGADAENYRLVNTSANTTAKINKKDLVAVFAGTWKFYDKGVDASSIVTGSSNDIISGDSVTVSKTAATFADKNVGAGKTVSITGVQLLGTDAANYSLRSPTSTTTTAQIVQKHLTASYTGSSKVYDGSVDATSAVTASSSDIISGDSVTISQTSATFADKNVGTGKAVSVSGIQLAGGDSGNYLLNNTSANTTASITPKSLTISGITASNKIYDGSASATVDTSNAVKSGIISLDQIDVAATGVFNNKNAGDNKPVTLTSRYSGLDVGNYAITSQAFTNASISKRVLAVTATVTNLGIKTYDGTRTASVDLTNDKVSGDELILSSTSASFDTKNVGLNKTVNVTGISITGGTDAGNYVIQNGATSTSGQIIARSLQITGITANDKTYDGNVNTTLRGTPAVTPLLNDVVNVTGTPTSTFDEKNVGTGKAVTTTGFSITGTDSSNYNLIPPALTATIRKANLTVSAVTDNKVYDGSLVSNNAATVGALALDDVLATPTATQAYLDKNAGTNKVLTPNAIHILDAFAVNMTGNYNISYVNNTTGVITKQDVSLASITANNKIYDGGTNATISSGVITGTIGSESLSVGGVGVFADKNVAAGIAVNVANVANLTKTNGPGNSGNWNNYNLTTTGPMATSADITKKDVTLTSITGDNKTYDGNAFANISSGVIAGTVASESLLVSGTGTFANKNAAVGKTVTVANVNDLAKTNNTGDWNNYNLTTAGALLTSATIRKANLTVSAVTDTKVYDGSLISNHAATVGTLVADDILATPVATQTYLDRNAGINKVIQPNAINILDAGALDMTGNYNINYVNSTTGVITKKDVSLASITASNKVYDGRTNATISSGVIAGTIGSESLLVSGTGAFSDKNAATGITVTVANVADLTKTNGPSNSGNWNNYNLTTTGPMATSADISKANLTVAAVTDKKIYDGTFISNGTATVSGIAAGDALATPATQAYTDKNAGTSKVIQPNPMAILDTDLADMTGNYTIRYVNNATGVITKRGVSLSSITANNKMYDGTTDATISSGVILGTAGSESLLVSGLGSFSDKNAAAAKTVTVEDVTALTKTNNSGDWNNYNLTTTGSIRTQASIMPLMDNCSRGNSSGCASMDTSPVAKVVTVTPLPPTQIANNMQQVIRQTPSAIAQNLVPVTSSNRATTTPSPIDASNNPKTSSEALTNNEAVAAAKSLTAAQVAQLSADEVAPLINALSVRQLLALTDVQISQLDAAQQNGLLSTINQLKNDAARVTQNTYTSADKVVAQYVTTGILKNQIESLSNRVAQLSKNKSLATVQPTPQKLADILEKKNPVDIATLLSTTQVKQLTSDQIAPLISSLSVRQLLSLTNEQISKLDPLSLNALRAVALSLRDNPSQAGDNTYSLADTAVAQYINTGLLKDTMDRFVLRTSYIAENKFKDPLGKELAALSSPPTNRAITSLTSVQIANLSPQDLGPLINQLTGSQLTAITNAQMAKLDSQYLSQLSTLLKFLQRNAVGSPNSSNRNATVFNSQPLSQIANAALLSDQPNTALPNAPTPATVSAGISLTPRQVAELSENQLAPLINQLNVGQLLAITDAQMARLDSQAISRLTLLMNFIQEKALYTNTTPNGIKNQPVAPMAAAQILSDATAVAPSPANPVPAAYSR